MLPPLVWTPSHLLTWTPRAGVVRSWPVRVIATTVGGRPARVAQTAEEDRRGLPPAWVRFDGETGWRWCGGGGYRGEAGAVELERLED